METERNRTLRITNAEESKEIRICQTGAKEEYHYRLLAICHILCYKEVVVDKALEDRLLYALEKANEFYQGNNGKSVDMNMEFFPATHDPDGKVLDRAGIHWRAHDVEKIHYQKLIDNDYGDVVWMWNPNKYINIYVFNFSRRTTYGATPLPCTPTNYALEGLISYDLYYKEVPDDCIPCVIVSTNIMDYDEGYMEQFTADQQHRVRHVLTYSPLIPGPKIPVALSPKSKSKVERRKVTVN